MNALTLRSGLALPAALSIRRGLSPQPGGGGPAPYHADAVHFDGSTYLHIGALTADATTPYFSMSYWVKAPTVASDGAVFVVDADNNYTDKSFFNSGAFDPLNTIGIYLYDPDLNAVAALTSTTPLGDGNWHNVLISARSDTAKIKIFVDGVDVTNVVFTDAAGPMAFGGLSFWFGGDGFGTNIVSDMADVWIAPGQLLLDGSNTIPAGTVLKFRAASGKPVSLGANGEAPTGTSPAIFFSGAATAFGANLGTGGAFTTTGTLTNASTSPSD